MGHTYCVDKFEFVALTNNKNAVLEDRQPDITSMKNFFSCSVTRHMTTTCPRMAVIENSLNLLDSKTLAKN